MPILGSLLLLLLRHVAAAAATTAAAPTPRVEVILVGATSSLARKYLFQSFFRAYLEEELKLAAEDPTKVRIHAYGGATREPEEGGRLLGEYLAGSVSCKGLVNATEGAAAQACEVALAAYRSGFQYVQLRGEAQYAELGRWLREQEQGKKGEGRLAGRYVCACGLVDRSTDWRRWMDRALPMDVPRPLFCILPLPFPAGVATQAGLPLHLPGPLPERGQVRRRAPAAHHAGRLAARGVREALRAGA